MTPQYTNLTPGWPFRFLHRASETGLRFYLMIDTLEDANAFQDLPIDGIVTDYIELVGPVYDPVPPSP